MTDINADLFAQEVEITRFPNVHTARGTRDRMSAANLLLQLQTPRRTTRKSDLPGWSPGVYRENRRCEDNVERLHAVVFDDDVSPTDWADTRVFWFGIAGGFIHTSFRHTPESPRYRAGLWLDRAVDGDEYRLIHAYVAERCVAAGHPVGVQASDPARFWYWPGAAPGAEYLFDCHPGPPLCANRIIAELANAGHVAASHNGDFRPAASVTEAFLARAFIHAGWFIRIIDDNRMAVRCPWEAEHTTGQTGDTSTVIFAAREGATLGAFWCSHEHCRERDSRAAMRVLPAGAKERAQADMPVADAPSVEPAPRPRVQGYAPHHSCPPWIEGHRDTAWCQDLRLGRSGEATVVLSTLANAELILRNDPCVRDAIWLDQFANQIVLARRPGWRLDERRGEEFPRHIRDADDIDVAIWLEREWGIALSPKRVHDAVVGVAEANARHPAREFLDSLSWDNEPRLDVWLAAYLGADDNAYTSAVGAAWLVSVVARIYRPGCKADAVLLLEGAQGVGKSTALRTLAGSEVGFTDEVDSVGSKDAGMQIQGVGIIELSELDALSRAETARTKAWISRTDDRFRVPYGRTVQTFPRQCVFAGTTNHEDPLRDETGNRRFWPVHVRRVLLDLVARDRLQLWAEAVARFRDGSPWWLDRDAEALAADEQEARRETNAWEEVLARELVGRGYDDDGLELSEILRVAFPNSTPEKWTKAMQMDIARSLRSIGWAKRRCRVGVQRPVLWFRRDAGHTT